jgi:hypothetical protein
MHVDLITKMLPYSRTDNPNDNAPLSRVNGPQVPIRRDGLFSHLFIL